MKIIRFVMLWLLVISMMGVSSAATLSGVPKVSSGSIERLENFPSKFVDARNIDVWLPEGYTASKDTGNAAKRYNVLYMQDGQMLFDASTTWNKQAWQVDVTMTRLMKEGKIPDMIVVGIWNNGKYRHTEYYPQKFLPLVAEPTRTIFTEKALQGKPRADDYLRFLVEELKPAIDSRFATRTDPASTFIMGSSMGGLISIYAMNEYPQVFGGAAGMSTHWIGAGEANAELPKAAGDYLRDHLASPENHRLYMDHGTTQLDAKYAPFQLMINKVVQDRGYTKMNALSRVFDGAGHNEQDWAKRLDIPILFLMGKR
jgi:enterochelin esterase-like enzyme